MSQPFLHYHASANIFIKITNLLKSMQVCEMHETVKTFEDFAH